MNNYNNNRKLCLCLNEQQLDQISPIGLSRFQEYVTYFIELNDPNTHDLLVEC